MLMDRWVYQISCFEAAILNDGCPSLDVACQCSKAAGLVDAVEPCIAHNCSAPNAQGTLCSRSCVRCFNSPPRTNLTDLRVRECYHSTMCQRHDLSCQPHRFHIQRAGNGNSKPNISFPSHPGLHILQLRYPYYKRKCDIFVDSIRCCLRRHTTQQSEPLNISPSSVHWRSVCGKSVCRFRLASCSILAGPDSDFIDGRIS